MEITNHHRISPNKAVKNLFLASLFFFFHVASIQYINSTFLSQLLSSTTINLLYICGGITTIFSFLYIPKINKKYGTRNIIKILGILETTSLLTLFLSINAETILVAFLIHIVVAPLFFIHLDTSIEDATETKNIGKIRGELISLIHIAYVLSPLLAGYIATNSSIRFVYLFSCITFLMFFIHLLIHMKNKTSGVYKEINMTSVWKEFVVQKGARRALFATCSLHIFYALSTIYVPLYFISEIGLSWERIGILLSIALTPFIFLGIPIGFLTNKKGEKIFLLAGFMLITVSMLIVPYVDKSQFLYFVLLFFISRIGAVCVEVSCDSYFFKIAKGKDELISIYRLGVPLAVIIAPLLGILIIPFGLTYTFFVIAGVTSIAFLVTLDLPKHTSKIT